MFIAKSLRTSSELGPLITTVKTPRSAAAQCLSRAYGAFTSKTYKEEPRMQTSYWLKPGVLYSVKDEQTLQSMPDYTDGSEKFNGGKGAAIDTVMVGEVLELRSDGVPAKIGKKYYFYGTY